jgi:peroxiredoxin
MDYAEKGLVVLGFNFSDDNKIALEFLGENGATFPTILDGSPEALKTNRKLQTLGMTAVPLTYVFDREGKVVDAWYGYEEGHERAKRALKKLGIEPASN